MVLVGSTAIASKMIGARPPFTAAALLPNVQSSVQANDR
jgi:hypothetical protein